MVDSISDEDGYRIARGAGIDPNDPDHRPTEAEIRDIIGDRYDDFTQTQIDGFAKNVDKQIERTETRQRVRREREREPPSGRQEEPKSPREKIAGELGIPESNVTLSGGGATGKRTTMVRDANGQFVGKASNVKTYMDNNGNLMGYVEGQANEPGGRRVLRRADNE